MEFHINMAGPMPNIAAIEHAVRSIDPAALVDMDPADHTLRVAASIDAVQLVSLINQAGNPVARSQVIQVPSTCCGGCSG